MFKLKSSALFSALVLLATVDVAQAVPLINNLGGDRGYGSQALLPNDDSSSAINTLPFSINFFGNNYSNFYINNNGNITFNAPVSTYTPRQFPISSQPMIAPFWADVDTRGVVSDGGNKVWVNSPNQNTLVVTWDTVGYFGAHTDKRNDFQLVLRNRADTGAGNFDIDFRYNQLQWTTGDWSGGTGGLGGTPAQAGFDAGNGTNFFALPGSFTEGVLNLASTSNVSLDTPGLWTFAIRNGATPGTSESNPLMPIVTQDGYNFTFDTTLGQRVWIDPLVAVGYDYIVNSGPNIATVDLPDSIGDGLYDIYGWDAVNNIWDLLEHDWAGSDIYDFGGLGVDRFRVTGIETGAGLDPNDPTAFVTGLTFVRNGQVNLTQRALSVNTTPNDVPLPGVLSLLAIGAAGVMASRRKNQA